jgi:hypothetical protein
MKTDHKNYLHFPEVGDMVYSFEMCRETWACKPFLRGKIVFVSDWDGEFKVWYNHASDDGLNNYLGDDSDYLSETDWCAPLNMWLSNVDFEEELKWYIDKTLKEQADAAKP